MRYTVLVEAVWCPALKGCHSQGEMQEEALENIREAVAAYLESAQADGLPLPADVTIHHSLLRGFRTLSLEGL
ncbi:MAG: type II toxin-antitoxin system HicB family antitoxin [Desulfurellaceae bacterium]|nr:type II toxin-antitoxin system HicB family antitoxin [Desulfurellaceae bacterium]